MGRKGGKLDYRRKLVLGPRDKIEAFISFSLLVFASFSYAGKSLPVSFFFFISFSSVACVSYAYFTGAKMPAEQRIFRRSAFSGFDVRVAGVRFVRERVCATC